MNKSYLESMPDVNGFFGKFGREGNTGLKDPNHRNFRLRGI